jgi:6-pyruvoyltetrahydropterin/6-carboxytetrahydropterin synthase
MRQLTLEWRTHFDAAHHLPGYDGPCSRMHGHRWEVLLILGPFTEDDLDGQGIAYDFRELKRGDAAQVIERYDHALLNDILTPPSAERLAFHLFDALRAAQVPVLVVKVYESPDACAVATER